MNESLQPLTTSATGKGGDSERTKQVTVVGWTAGVSAVVALGILSTAPTWPMAFGVAAVSGMVASVCFFILKQ